MASNCIGCGPRPDRVIRTGVTEPFDFRRAPPGRMMAQGRAAYVQPYRPIVAGAQAVIMPGRAAPLAQVAVKNAARKFGNAIRAVAAKFARGQAVTFTSNQGRGSMQISPRGPTPGGIVGQLVAAAKAVVAGRPVVVRTASGIDRVLPGRAARFERTNVTPGFARARSAATAVTGTRAVAHVDARIHPDKRGRGVKARILATRRGSAALQALRKPPGAFNQSAYATPYTSIYGKR